MTCISLMRSSSYENEVLTKSRIKHDMEQNQRERGKEDMKFLDAEFVQGFIRMANDGWEQGWHERNGGNLSYRVKPEEVEAGAGELFRKRSGSRSAPRCPIWQESISL